MRVELMVQRATVFGMQDVGDKIDVPDAEAVRMIGAGHAVAVRSVQPERAVKPKRAEKANRG